MNNFKKICLILSIFQFLLTPLIGRKPHKKSPYKILCIQPGATKEEIKSAYKRRALKWHPDHNLGQKEIATRKMQQINAARDELLSSTYSHIPSSPSSPPPPSNHSSPPPPSNHSHSAPPHYSETAHNFDDPFEEFFREYEQRWAEKQRARAQNYSFVSVKDLLIRIPLDFEISLLAIIISFFIEGQKPFDLLLHFDKLDSLIKNKETEKA